mmetsp:Transcript_22625/g.60296  ORF Transcript_22625/g.60296 Transcript_22625/m.60296 type:complete len:218 (+) Transcript_22625:431-1084(+)
MDISSLNRARRGGVGDPRRERHKLTFLEVRADFLHRRWILFPGARNALGEAPAAPPSQLRLWPSRPSRPEATIGLGGGAGPGAAMGREEPGAAGGIRARGLRPHRACCAHHSEGAAPGRSTLGSGGTPGGPRRNVCSSSSSGGHSGPSSAAGSTGLDSAPGWPRSLCSSSSCLLSAASRAPIVAASPAGCSLGSATAATIPSTLSESNFAWSTRWKT